MHELSEFSGLEFADFEHKQHQNLTIGILIGIDYYHVFMTGNVIKSKMSPVACKTKAGWIISGRIGSSASDMHCSETHLLRASVNQVVTEKGLR